DVERGGQLLVDAGGDEGGVGAGAHVVDEDRELVAAEAGERVAGTDAALEAPGDFDEELVAREVAQAVVDDLEAVHVDEEDGEAVVGPPGREADRLAEAVEEEGAVGKAGQGIVEGVVDELLLEGLALGDVDGGDHGVAELARAVAER